MFENKEEKIYFSISEVCKMLDLKPYHLRNWEQNIPFLKPKKNKFGHRIYTKSDINKIMLVKNLLYEEKYTIKGVVEYFLKKYEDIETKELKTNIANTEKIVNMNDENINKLWVEIKKISENLKKIIDKKLEI